MILTAYMYKLSCIQICILLRLISSDGDCKHILFMFEMFSLKVSLKICKLIFFKTVYLWYVISHRS